MLSLERREPTLWLSNEPIVTIYCGGRTSLYLQLASHLLKRVIGYHQTNSLIAKTPKNINQTKKTLYINLVSFCVAAVW